MDGTIRCHHIDYRLGIARLERAIEICDIIMSPTQDGPITSIFMQALMRRDSARPCIPLHLQQRFERFVVTRRAQICQICLSERR